MSPGAAFSIFKCVYFIPVSCLISVGVPAATPLGIQALDLMPVEMTWCWLFLWCTYILYCPWYIGNSDQILHLTRCAVLYLVVEQMAFPFLSCAAPLPLRILWLGAKTFQCSAGCVLSLSVADWMCVKLICFWQCSGKPCFSLSYKTMDKFM